MKLERALRHYAAGLAKQEAALLVRLGESKDEHLRVAGALRER